MTKTVEEVLDETWGEDDSAKPKPVFHMPKKIDADKLPSALKRAKSAHGFLSAWRKLRNAVWVARGIPYPKLPEFAVLWGKLLYNTHERQAYAAIVAGDVMFFEGWAGRLSMIDLAASEAGLSVADRGTILYAYAVLKGYSDTAAERLKALGGKWPPK